MNEQYKLLLAEAKKLNQRNFCGPLAAAAASGIEFADSIARFEALGRNRRSGVFKYMYQQILADLGFAMVRVSEAELNRLEPSMALSTNSVSRNVEAWRGKTYFARGDGHVCTIIDGEIIDWTADCRMRILELYEIQSKEPS